MSKDSVKIEYIFEYKEPIRVPDFSPSLLGLDQQYVRFLKRSTLSITDPKIRFHIKDVRKGSFALDLIPIFTHSLVFPNDIKSVFNFLSNFKMMLDFIRGMITEPPFNIEKADLQNAKSIVSPVVRDHASNLTLIAMDGAHVDLRVDINSKDGMNINEGADKFIKKIETPENVHLTNQLLYFRSAEDTLGMGKADKGVIDRISNERVQVKTPEEIKEIFIRENALTKMFLVDVTVLTVERVPKLYIIDKLHEVYDRD